MFARLDRWHKTKPGFLLAGLVEFVIAYVFASLAINDGSLWLYLLTLIFLFGALRNITKLIGAIFHGWRGK